MLDTDILSEVFEGKNAVVTAKAEQYRDAFGQFTISAVTVVEVVKGLHKLARPQRLQAFLDAIAGDEVLPLDRLGAQIAGRIYADLERNGQTIGRADPLIAATAIHHSLVLVTGNTAHCERIQALGYQLELDNWRE